MNFVQAEYVIGMVMVQIKINGEIEEIKDNTTLQNILDNKKLPSVFVVELNKIIIRKDNYKNTILKDGDTVEIATFCSGG